MMRALVVELSATLLSGKDVERGEGCRHDDIENFNVLFDRLFYRSQMQGTVWAVMKHHNHAAEERRR
jgi:hypothetical protein